MAIDLEPATNPLDIPSPRPSEIVRNWPARLAKHVARLEKGGAIHFCSIGLLNEIGGYEWGESDLDLGDYGKAWSGSGESRAVLWCREYYGLSLEQAVDLANINGSHGKDAAADFLESIGL